ncbi:MAG: methylenetetrahydrofolate reductase, partial [Xanthobacteraceae bacterium]
MNDESAPGLSTFAERLRQRRFAITAEIAPPLSCDAQDLVRKVAGLKGLADAVNVTDGAGARASMSALAAASILLGMGVEPILQIACRDKNR